MAESISSVSGACGGDMQSNVHDCNLTIFGHFKIVNQLLID